MPRAVSLAAASADAHHDAGELNRVAPLKWRVEELSGVRVRGANAGPAAHANPDADSGVRAAVALDVFHHQVGAERLRGVAHVEVRGIGAMLQHIAPAEREHP